MSKMKSSNPVSNKKRVKEYQASLRMMYRWRTIYGFLVLTTLASSILWFTGLKSIAPRIWASLLLLCVAAAATRAFYRKKAESLDGG